MNARAGTQAPRPASVPPAPAAPDVQARGLRGPGADPEVELLHVLVAPQLLGGALEDEAAALQHVAVVGDGQGLVRVLLDQEHAHAAPVDLADHREDLLDQQRRLAVAPPRCGPARASFLFGVRCLRCWGAGWRGAGGREPSGAWWWSLLLPEMRGRAGAAGTGAAGSGGRWRR